MALVLVRSAVEWSFLPALADPSFELGAVHGVRPRSSGAFLHDGTAMCTERREWR